MKSLLVVVDYQNDSVIGSLGFREAVCIEEGICNKIKKYKAMCQDIIFTLDTHYGQEFELGNIKKHNYSNSSEGWQLYGRVKELNTPDTMTISKHCFGSIDLCNLLSRFQYDCVEFVGVITNMCVLSNAIIAQAALPEASIIVDAACVASNKIDLHNKALDIMEELQFKVINR